MTPATLLPRIATLLLVAMVCVHYPTLSVKAATAPPDVQVKHVYLVMLENHSYSSIIGNKSMPSLNALAKKYAYASAYYANTHPSIGNYFELTTGKLRYLPLLAHDRPGLGKSIRSRGALPVRLLKSSLTRTRRKLQDWY